MTTDPPPVPPDSFVALIPVVWDSSEISVLSEVHPQVWAELLVPVDPPTHPTLGAFRVGEDPDGPSITIIEDEPLPQLADLLDHARQPFLPAEALQLRNHSSLWRITLTDVRHAPLARARAFLRVLSTACEAGAPAVFLPSSLQLHPASLVRHLATEHRQPQTLTNLFVSAFNDDDWMVSRGLTAFGLPELETPIVQGLNAAFFRLMDLSCAMIAQESPLSPDRSVQLGPDLLTVETGPLGPPDTGIPVNGSFGRLTLRD